MRLLDCQLIKGSVQSTILDALVIGSSPLMLMLAIRLARLGQSVSVLDEVGELGGAWRKAEIFDGEFSEMACHLVEPYDGVYSLLEEYSGEPFEVLEPQPQRLLARSTSVAYGGRLITTAAGLKNLVLDGWLSSGALVSGQDSDRAQRLRRKVEVCRANFRTFAKAQVPMMWKDGILLQGPRNGFGHFIAGLISRARSHSIDFATGRVVECRPVPGGWRVHLEDGSFVDSRRTYVSQSVGLVEMGDGQVRAVPPTTYTHFHRVIEVRRSLVISPMAYAVIRANPLVKRLSRLDRPLKDEVETGYLYLIQLRKGDTSLERYGPELLGVMKRLGILSSSSRLIDLCERDRIDMSFAGASEDATMRSYANGGLYVLPTIGNLSRSVVETARMLRPSGFNW